MKYLFLVLFALFFGVSALILPAHVSACETYENCDSPSDRNGDDRRDRDPVDNPGDNDRDDNEPNDPAF